MNCKHCEPLINGETHILQEGFSAYQNGDHAKAFQLLLPQAEAGSATAQCLVGSLYSLGWGVSLNGDEAVKWYLKAGQQGCGLSYNNLATIYQGTLPDVGADPEKAKECRRKAIENCFQMIAESE